MKRKNKKNFFQNVPTQGVHIISDLETGEIRMGRLEDLNDEDFFDDCIICQKLKEDAKKARAKGFVGESSYH